MEVHVLIKCSADDCPLNRKYEGFVLANNKKIPFRVSSFKDIVAQLEAVNAKPVFKPLVPNDRAIVEAKQLGFKIDMQ